MRRLNNERYVDDSTSLLLNMFFCSVIVRYSGKLAYKINMALMLWKRKEESIPESIFCFAENACGSRIKSTKSKLSRLIKACIMYYVIQFETRVRHETKTL